MSAYFHHIYTWDTVQCCSIINKSTGQQPSHICESWNEHLSWIFIIYLLSFTQIFAQVNSFFSLFGGCGYGILIVRLSAVILLCRKICFMYMSSDTSHILVVCHTHGVRRTHDCIWLFPLYFPRYIQPRYYLWANLKSFHSLVYYGVTLLYENNRIKWRVGSRNLTVKRGKQSSCKLPS